MQTRRSSQLSSLVLPHPPLPKRTSSIRSSTESFTSPRTPRSSSGGGRSSPHLFKMDSCGPRRSTDSWNSSIHDGGDDDMEWEWTVDQLGLLSKTLDALPSHLLSPFNGTVPPANVLDKISRSIINAKDPLEWPHSIRSTRIKLLKLSRARAREFGVEGGHLSTELSTDILQPTTNVQKKPLYRQSSMDFIKGNSLKNEKAIERLSSRLQKVDRIIPDPTRAYTRSSSRTPSPPPLRNQIVNRNETPRTPRTPNSEVVWVRGPPSSISGSRGSRLRRTTTAVPTISSGVAKQRGGTETPNNGYRLPKIKRSESFSSPNMNGLGHSLKRAPSYGSVSARSIDSRMSIDDQKENILSPQSQLDIYPSSDDEEKTRSQKIKKQKVGEEKKVPLKAASSATLKPKSSKSNTKGNTRAKKVQPKKLIPSEFGAALPHPQPEPVPPPSRIELPPSSPLCPFLLDDEENTGFSTPISPVTPAKRLRRVKTANFPGVRRRISFGHLSTPIEDDREGEQSGSILGSAFRMH